VKEIKGILEIDENRGVMYFHDESTGMTALRISRLPTPIPDPVRGEMLDITHGHGASWSPSNPLAKNDDQIDVEFMNHLMTQIALLNSDQLENLFWRMAGMLHLTWEESGDTAFKDARDWMMETSAVIHNRSGN
jgi:hypothetical protein